MIQFDKQGYLFPYEIIELSLIDFKAYFVTELPGKDRRKEIFKMYHQYLSELFEVVGKEFYQLVNGSFTTKKELPGDIDFITFVNYRVYRNSFEAIDKLNLKWGNSNEIDSMILPFSYPGHPHFIQCNILFETKKNLYGNSRPDQFGNVYPKGIIKIQFNG